MLDAEMEVVPIEGSASEEPLTFKMEPTMAMVVLEFTKGNAFDEGLTPPVKPLVRLLRTP